MKNYNKTNHRFLFIYDDIILYDKQHDEHFCLFSGLVLMRNGEWLVKPEDYYDAVYDEY